jgi:hypothetical protein
VFPNASKSARRRRLFQETTNIEEGEGNEVKLGVLV